jgi:hypothetical protein
MHILYVIDINKLLGICKRKQRARLGQLERRIRNKTKRLAAKGTKKTKIKKREEYNKSLRLIFV